MCPKRLYCYISNIRVDWSNMEYQINRNVHKLAEVSSSRSYPVSWMTEWHSRCDQPLCQSVILAYCTESEIWSGLCFKYWAFRECGNSYYQKLHIVLYWYKYSLQLFFCTGKFNSHMSGWPPPANVKLGLHWMTCACRSALQDWQLAVVIKSH